MFASKDVFLNSSGGGYTIARSVRFRSSASGYLNRTFATPTSSTIWTWSAWVKRGGLTGTYRLFGASTTTYLTFNSSDQLNLTLNGTSAATTTAVYRDPSSWYHIVYQQNGSAQTIYVNSVSVATGTTAASVFNTAIAHQLGAANTTNYFDGYMAEVNFVDGQALTPSSFGATDATTGVWQPKKYTGTYGTNGFYLNFSSNSTAAALGTDFSGNSNTWTVNNISVTAGTTYDSMTDVPTLTSATAANYPTWNAVNNSTTNSYTFSNGNLSATVSTTSGGRGITSTSGMTSTSGFKYYAELTVSAWGGSSNADVGILSISTSVMTTSSFALSGCIGTYLSNGYSINKGGNVYNNGTSLAAGLTTFVDGDIVQIAYDGTYIYFGKNGTWLNSAVPASGTGGFSVAAGTYAFAFGVTSNTSQTGTVIGNFGQRPFSYTAPTGFVALNTYNLSTPTIPNGATVMAATTYTGTGAALTVANTVNGTNFQPDWVWVKGRSGATDHAWYDVLRGTTKQLESNNTAAETTESTGLTAFGSTGFTVGALAQMNTSAATYVAWQWAANGTGVSNTSGSITSTVSAGATQGFSVVTYTGTGANATVGHGLGVVPSMVIVKRRDTTSTWQVRHTSIAVASSIQLNSTAASASATTVWNSTAPTSTVFSIGTSTDVNASSGTYVAYVFAAVAGYSAFDSYTGNGSADGPFVFLGFKPRWIMIKNSTTISAWLIIDTSRQNYNVEGPYLVPNTSDAETTGTTVFDLLSNGFKCRSATTANSSGSTYIYACFAENPFKYSLAR